MPATYIGTRWYCTDTARHVHGPLYRKNNGEFFSCEDGAITPLSEADAEAWLRENAPEAHERLFGEPPEGARVGMSLYGVDARAKALAYREAKRTGRPVGEIVSECIMLKLG